MGNAVFEEHDDPTVYPEEERVGEEMLQRWISELLRPLLERYLNGEGEQAPCFVGADQFIYYRQHDPVRRFAPDIYVVPGLSPDTRVVTWKTWIRGKAPSFALEVVSSNWRKDYFEAPARCAEAGFEELVVFDPDWAERPGDEGARFQVYRRRGDGPLELAAREDGDRVRSETLNVWFRASGFGDRTRLRLARDPDGEHWIPTGEEAERAEKEAERAEKEAAQARVRELEARLAELEKKS